MKRKLLSLVVALVFSSFAISQVTSKIIHENLTEAQLHGPTVEVPQGVPGSTRAVGDDCITPIVVSVPAALPYNDLNQTNCGRLNTYSTTCLGSYDGGEDIIYRLDVTTDVVVDITMDPKGTTWTGILIADDCPDVGTCLDFNTGSSGIRTMSGVSLTAAGSPYYIMVDTWPTPNCIPDFDLTIVEITCPDPTAQTETNITATSADLGWTESGSATTWQIEWGTTGFLQGAGTLVVTASNPYLLSGLSAATTYDWYVRAICGVGDTSAWTGPSTFTTLALCPAPTAQTETNITSSSADLGWTTGGASTWDIEWGPTGFTQGSGTMITGTTLNPYTLSGLTQSTTYDWYVRDDCGGGNGQSAWVGPSTFTTLALCPAPSAQTETNITATSADLGWTTGGATTWNIEWGPTGFTQGSGTMISGTTSNPYTLSGLTAATTYDWYVQDDCGGGNGQSAWVGPSTFTTACATFGTPFSEDFTSTATPTCWGNAGAESWLFSTGAAYGAAAAGDHTAGGGTNYAWIDGSGGIQTNELLTPYVDVSGLTTPAFEFYYFSNNTDNPGDNNTLTVDFWDGAAWNNLLTYTGDNPAWQHGLYDLSGYTITGDVQFRFVVTETAATAYYNDILVDDVGVDEYPSCLSPSAQTETNITQTSADLGWTENGSATTWNIEWGPTGFTQGSGTMITGTTTNPHTLSGLTTNTTYDWYVQADCGGSTSAWIGPSTFTTLPGAHTLPLSEDFETGFTNFDNAAGNTVDWVMNTTLFHGGTQCAHNPYTSSNANILHETGILDLSSTTAATLSFWQIAKTEGGWDKCFVEISTDGGSTYSALPAGTYLGAGTGYGTAGYFDEDDYPAWGTGSEIPDNTWWRHETFDLSTYNVANVRFRFRLTADGSIQRDGWYLDDILVEEPSCPQPTAQTETNITQTSADLGWTESGTATTWNIEWGPAGFTQGSGTMITGTTTNPHSLTGLTASTTYDWYVQADCGGSQSGWTGPSTFNTTCAASTTVPYFENFDAVTAPAFPPCMTVEDVNADLIMWETNTTSLSAPNSARITYNAGLAMDDWFFTEGLQLTGGVTYEVSFAYAGESSSYPEKLAVDWGTAATAASMSGTPIFDNNNILGGWFAGSGTFTPATSGIYFVGFHGYSDANMWNLYVDDVKVLEQVAATTWAGTVDNDWDTPGNWSAGLPSSTTDVTIPTGLTNYPTLASATTIGSLLVASDATGDASILNDGLLVVSGNATVQRYVTGGVWHDVSASAQGQTLNSVYFGGTPEVWLTHYDEPTNTRTYLTNLTDPMDPGAGFEIWVQAGNDVTINYTGLLQRADVVLTTTSTPPLSYSGPDPLGYNLIGNPFASPIDLDLGTWALTDVSTSFWVWDPVGGTYVDWNTATGIGTLTGGIVPMGQGFFMQATGAAPTITVPMGARVHSTQGFYKKSNAGKAKGYMSLKVLKEEKKDETNIAFLKEATDEFDTYDTRKMFAFEGDAPQIYSEQYGEELSINGLPVLNGEGKSVRIGFIAGTDGAQMIEANLENLPETEVFLEDLFTGEVQSLVDQPQYKFEASVGDEPERFILHFNPTVTGMDDPAADPEVRVYAFDGAVYIQSKGKAAKEKKEIWIYDMYGRTVVQTTAHPSTLNRIPVDRTNAYLIVRTVSESGVTTQKVYIN